MKDDTVWLLKMIKNGKTINEITKSLKISNKQLFMRLSMLRNSGYIFDKVYHYNGDIQYAFKDLVSTNKDEVKRIIVPKNTKKLNAILISDTHFGHKDDSKEIIDSIYNFCIQEGIHIIFNAGDIFEGIFKERAYDNKCLNAQEQVNYGLKTYPYDKNILNFIVLGNHDATFYLEAGIDIKTILEERRHDIVPTGYGTGEVYFGDFEVKLFHPISRNGVDIDYSDSCCNKKIVLRGHSHKFKISNGLNYCYVHVPSVSNIEMPNNKTVPSMIKMELELDGSFGYIKNELFEQYVFINNTPIRVSEIEFDARVPATSHFDENKLKEKWNYPNFSDGTLGDRQKIKETEVVSQVDKFNQKYGVDKPVQKVKK